MERILTAQTPQKKGEMVKVCGWVETRRDHGKLIFIDLKDRSGVLQCVFTPGDAGLHKLSDTLRSSWVVEMTGQIAARPAGMVNTEIPTGEIELQVSELKILNESQTPPFALDTDGMEIGEDLRMKYRYLDLRRNRLQKNIGTRHHIIQFIRTWLAKKDFVEIETPILTRSTPEGARDYVVPSRLQHGKFYALPQAPQQYKQLLMVAGFERYFQIARCFRDEDTRGDRQPEFTQLDLEMSFVEKEDVMAINERLLIDLTEKIFPQKKIQEIPFPRISYKEVMEKYGTDRPDLRQDKNNPNLLAFGWIVDFPFFEKAKDGLWTFTHNPFSRPRNEHMDWLINKEKISEILTTQYDVVLNGFEIGGGSIRNHQAEPLKKVFEIMGFDEKRIADNFGHMLTALSYGAPPHGGIAWGLDRLVSILMGEPNIREVFSFPKTGDGRDLMMNAPSEISPEQLKELGLKIVN
ncbi:MAG: aspartate--tRNA ligase [Candidatus Sungbacteria bacterium]|uniref:Aspartate--tRNA(Asp/Asn) ligase n=1 Tax=Candidatus Sungiibacteriota bacterium TaxID=2750080 RepID=A0A9D6DRP1_9BACT|nr:aspartate--tRNA ligase [Candidatus Sungbacteria bacterium]